MDINSILFVGIIILELMIYGILFSKGNTQKAIKSILKGSEEYNDIENFIQIKKHQFGSGEKSLGLFLGFIIVIILGMKITGLLSLIGFVLMGIILIPGVVIYRKLNELHSIIIRELYIEKDRKNE